MGLFSVLTESTTGQTAASGGSGSIPTVLQLYVDTPIQLEETSVLSGYSALTYQAIQIGSQEEEEVKNRHQTPDLGVWNCRVTSSNKSTSGEPPLVDSLLATMATQVRVFLWTVDLTDPSKVEPTLSLLQNVLVRFLIRHPPPMEPERQTATTSLFQLQSIEFGKANEDPKENSKQNVNESFKSVTTTLMICAQVPPEGEENSTGTMADDHSPDAYKQKQAQALVIYHLRKFAAALNCSLCFVPKAAAVTTTSKENAPPESTTAAAATTTTTTNSLQPTVDYGTLSQWWRDLALDQAIWETSSGNNNALKALEGDDDAVIIELEEEPAPETVVVATALYGPGKHQEDLIESVVLRSANYPGHWDAQKDSLWVALPFTPKEESDATSKQTGTGDMKWLGQLRESIASANDLPPPASVSPEKRPGDDDKKDGKDAEVSDFFASLLKKP